MIDFTAYLGELTADESVQEVESLCVVRLTTSYWQDDRGLHFKKSLNFLRRKCTGYNVLAEDAAILGVFAVLTRIINLDQYRDGIFSVVTCNEDRDWESDCIEDYDYKLVPFEQTK